MNDDQTECQAISAMAKDHIRDLIKQGKVEYEVFDIVNALDASASDIKTIRERIFEIIEMNEKEGLRWPKWLRRRSGREIYTTTEKLLKLKHSDTAMLFRIWGRCLAAAQPDRKTMRVVRVDFASLVPTLSTKLDKRFMELTPELVERHKQAAFQIASVVSDNLSKLDSTEQALKYLDFLGKYLSTASEKGLKGFLSLSLVLFCLADTDVLEQFEKECPPNVLERTEHAEEFVIKCGAAIHEVPEEIRNKYIELCMIAARQSFGSAMFIASDLSKKLEQLDRIAKDQYIDSFTEIITKVGICSVGFCSSRLHKLFLSHSSGEVQRLVELICEIATKYGSCAAFDFIERKTRSSKRLRMKVRDCPILPAMLGFILLVFIILVWIFKIVQKQ